MIIAKKSQKNFAKDSRSLGETLVWLKASKKINIYHY